MNRLRSTYLCIVNIISRLSGVGHSCPLAVHIFNSLLLRFFNSVPKPNKYLLVLNATCQLPIKNNVMLIAILFVTPYHCVIVFNESLFSITCSPSFHDCALCCGVWFHTKCICATYELAVKPCAGFVA